MATTATLTAVSPTNTTNSNSSSRTETSNRKPTYRRLSSATSSGSPTSMEVETSDGLNKTNAMTRTTPSFRIPKLGRPNSDLASPPSEMNGSLPISSSTIPTHKSSGFLNRQSSDESNSQQSKRKFSLSQYKERKRLKSDELQQNNFTDTDMRIQPSTYPAKASPPMPVDEDPSNLIETSSIISPKSDETSKDIVMKSNLSEPGVRKVIKKKVVWADDRSQPLVQTSFFEVDDSELSDMHIVARTCAANISIAQLEKVMERDFRKRRGVQDVNGIDTDDKQFSTPLPALIRILLPDTVHTSAIISKERFIQEKREETVLQALFIRSFLPDSPGEPDGDLLATSNSERIEPKLIPLEDNTGAFTSSKVTSVNSQVPTTTPTANTAIATTTTTTIVPTLVPPMSTTNPTPTAVTTPSLVSFLFNDVSPEVARILAQAQGNLSSATTNHSSTTNTLINPSSTLTPMTAPAISTLTTNNPTLTATTNLPAPPNFLSNLFNVARSTGAGASAVSSTNAVASLLPNLPINFNLPPPPTNFPFDQLLASALSLGIPPPSTFTASPLNLPNPTVNSVSAPSANAKPPSVRFVSAMGQQIRPNMNKNNTNEHQLSSSSSSRENSREHHFRRGQHNNHHHHHHQRRDYYPNRQNNNHHNNNNNNNNNNNRNIFQ